MKSKIVPTAAEPIALVNPPAPTAEEIQARIDAHVAACVAAKMSPEDALADAKAHIAHDALLATEKAARESKAAAAAKKAAPKAKAPSA